jgi:hypothetical protein
VKKDFHYHAVGVLARAAGLSVADALTIAYASQYVDDSVESDPIRVGSMLFDPVRTAHYGLRAFDWGVQKKVYMPFHFLPARPGETFLTRPDSEFASLLWRHALTAAAGLRRLCAMGVALHTFADTFAHQGFSGREHPENDVEAIHHWDPEEREWDHLFLPNFYLDLAPTIGHAQAGDYPDLPWLRWKYRAYRPSRRVTRDNTTEFLAAARRIHELLAATEQSDPAAALPFSAVEPRIRRRFQDRNEDLEDRCDAWRRDFADLVPPSDFSYSPLTWRKDAFSPRSDSEVRFEDFSRAKLGRLRFGMRSGFYDSPWVHFHRAALEQRYFVLTRLL